ncbi:hypothetical protein LTR37_001520 [Vermiconidia calcicola]|uniref:Uncharacterized protein n=1 Tax=Vermiconidia calcicola TaxID=1690605 RepID=A0ACC3NUZ6_9PEZI|nr:hypothetical protein LTR37_001520 [Vermiconidia calcicola]
MAYAEVHNLNSVSLTYFIDEGSVHLDPDTFPSSIENYLHEYLGDLLRHRTETSDNERFAMWERFPEMHRYVCQGSKRMTPEGTSSKKEDDLTRPYRELYHRPESTEQLHGFLDEFATVFVGPTKEPFVVHKGFLCRESEYFQGALNGRFSKSESMQVTLENESVRVFAMFVAWMYTRDIPDLRENAPTAPSGKTLYASTRTAAASQNGLESAAAGINCIANDAERVKRDLVDLFIFADRRGI